MVMFPLSVFDGMNEIGIDENKLVFADSDKILVFLLRNKKS